MREAPKKNGDKSKTIQTITLITAILNLLKTIGEIIKALID